MELDSGIRRPLEIKVCLVGEAQVGKSCLALRFAKNKFVENPKPTIGASFFAKEVGIADGIHLKYNIWDTAGQERYRSLAPLYYREAVVIILVYDVTNERSFQELREFWVKAVNENSPDNVIRVIAGNKCDLEDRRQIPERNGKEFAESIGVFFFEMSAKTSENVEEMFQVISQHLLMREKENPRFNPDVIDLEKTGNKNNASLLCRLKTIFTRC